MENLLYGRKSSKVCVVCVCMYGHMCVHIRMCVHLPVPVELYMLVSHQFYTHDMQYMSLRY